MGVWSGAQLAVFCRPVVTAPTVVRRDGTVLADGWLPDFVRLGELKRHLRDSVIEAAVDAALTEGRPRPRQRRRIMSYPLVIRLMIAMTLMPDASYYEALHGVAGLLADIPFILPRRLIYAFGMEFTEVIKRRKMVRAFTSEPLASGTADRLLKAAERAPSAGFSQGYSFLVLEGAEQCAPLWKILAEAVDAGGGTKDEDPAEVTALSTAQLVIVPLACKDVYLDRYAQPDKGLTDRDESRHPVPYWYVDTGFTALLILLAVTDEGLGASFFGFDSRTLPGFRAQFGVPAEWMPIGAIAIGHPDPANDPIRPARASERKPLTELVHRGHW